MKLLQRVAFLICFRQSIFVYKVLGSPVLKSGTALAVVLLFVFSQNLENVAIYENTIAFSVMDK